MMKIFVYFILHSKSLEQVNILNKIRTNFVDAHLKQDVANRKYLAPASVKVYLQSLKYLAKYFRFSVDLSFNTANLKDIMQLWESSTQKLLTLEHNKKKEKYQGTNKIPIN